jgi:parallel beta-helix repeat protein
LLDDANAAAQRTTLAAVGTADLAASTGAALVGSIQTGTGATARTVQAKLRDVVNVFDYGATGDGTTDDTTALQACYTANAGAVIDHGNGKTYIISATLNVGTGSILQGSSTIKAKNATAIAGAMLLGTAVSDVQVRNLKLNGNASGSDGAHFGVFLTGGSRNVVENIHVYDTIEAGILLEGESGSKVLNNQVITCGRVAGTSNHGICVWAITATPLQNIVIAGNTVTTAFRKGITTYSTGVGVVREVAIYGNTVSDCELGGIYVGSSANTYPQIGISITGNVCFDNYTNITLGQSTGGVVAGNTCRDDTARFGIEVIESAGFAVTGNYVTDSSQHGILLSKGTTICTNGVVSGNSVTRSNTTSIGFGCGILLEGATNISVTGNSVTDDAARMTHGIAENGTADQNVIGLNKVLNSTTANYLVIGASTTSITQTGRMTGIGVNVPLNTLHVGGGITLSTQNWTLANTNANTALPSNPGALVVSGPTGNYTISGIAGGHNGQLITVFNYTSYTMQLLNNDGGSSAGNRFLIGGGSRTLASFGAVQLMYSSQASAWTVIGSQG